jgi:hypothetical protein
MSSAIQTYSGRLFRPLDPDAGEIVIDDIVHALAHQCRFGGHSRTYYSVAQHSCLVADVVASRDGDRVARRWALLHDASEAYLVDLPHPLKHAEFGALYRAAEDKLMRAVCERFGLPPDPPPVVKDVDRAMLATERRALMAPGFDWPELSGVESLEVEIDPWQPEDAVYEFLERWEACS